MTELEKLKQENYIPEDYFVVIGDISSELFDTINWFCNNPCNKCSWRLNQAIDKYNKQNDIINGIHYLTNENLFDKYGNLKPQLEYLEFLIEKFFWPNGIIIYGCIEYEYSTQGTIFYTEEKDEINQLVSTENKLKEIFFDKTSQTWLSQKQIDNIIVFDYLSKKEQEEFLNETFNTKPFKELIEYYKNNLFKLFSVSVFKEWDFWWKEKLLRLENEVSKIYNNMSMLQGYGKTEYQSVFESLYTSGIGQAWLIQIMNNLEINFIFDNCNNCEVIWCSSEICEKCKRIFEFLRTRYRGNSGFILVDTGRCYLYDTARKKCKYKDFYADWNTFVYPCNLYKDKSDYENYKQMLNNRKADWGIIVF